MFFRISGDLARARTRVLVSINGSNCGTSSCPTARTGVVLLMCVYHLTARLESAWLRARVYVYRSHYDGACVCVCAVWLCVNHGREIPYRMCCYAVFARFKRAHTSRQQCGTSTHAVLDCALCTLIKCHCNAIQMLNFKVKY